MLVEALRNDWGAVKTSKILQGLSKKQLGRRRFTGKSRKDMLV